MVSEAEADAKARVDAAKSEAEMVTAESKRRAQERLSQAVTAAREAAEEKLREAELTAMEWVRAAEAEAERVASAHIQAAGQVNLTAPIVSPAPIADEYVDEPAVEADEAGDDQPREVSGDEGALASATKRRAVRRR
jgi:hypothetical protein